MREKVAACQIRFQNINRFRELIFSGKRGALTESLHIKIIIARAQQNHTFYFCP